MAKAILKFPGGKADLADRILDILSPKLRTEGCVYHEPFGGGASTLFRLRERFPEVPCHLADANADLLNLYAVLSADSDNFFDELRRLESTYNALPSLEAKSRLYYSVRSDFSSQKPAESAASFLFLNRTGYNGLVRYSILSGYNVPWGQVERVSFDYSNLVMTAMALRTVVLSLSDFLASSLEEYAPGHVTYCFAPGSQVLTAQETLMNVEQIAVGDALYGDRRVVRTLRRHYEGDIYRIKVQGSPHVVSVTADHPMLSVVGRPASARQDVRSLLAFGSQAKFVPASSLKVGDYLFQPTVNTSQEVDWAALWHSLTSAPVSKRQKHIQFVPELQSLFKLLGYYAAEGHINYSKARVPVGVVWSFNRLETHLIDDVLDCCHKVFVGCGASSFVGRPHDSVTQIAIHSKSVAEFFSTLIPGQTRSRTEESRRFTMHLSPEIMSADPSLQLCLLKGWLSGDGGVWRDLKRGKTKVTGTSACFELARQMYRIAQRCGLRPLMKKRGRSFDVYFSSATDTEKLGYSSPRLRESCSTRRIVGGLISSKIAEITRLAYSGDVFNLEVSNDHLLCVDGVISHNCDPPYVGGFSNYMAGGFSEADHIALSFQLRSLTHRGVSWALSGAPSELYEDLFPRTDFSWYDLTATRSINCDGDGRGSVSEILITNF